MILASIFWNPTRSIFTIPGTHIEVYWYSLFFALGLLGGYWIGRFVLCSEKSQEEQEQISNWLEKLIFWMFIGILIGARVGHVLFYEPSYYWAHPEEIIMTWKGGLSSHGGIAGLLIACYIFWKKNHIQNISWNNFLDAAAIGSSLTATCIRVGNFFNQEIIGLETSSPFGVIFGSPMELLLHPNQPHHPVQLYEALVSGVLLFFLLFLKKRASQFLASGQLAGIYLVILFTARCILETVKLPQSTFDSHPVAGMQMGQLLSIPLLMYGCFLILHPYINRKKSQ